MGLEVKVKGSEEISRREINQFYYYSKNLVETMNSVSRILDLPIGLDEDQTQKDKILTSKKYIASGIYIYRNLAKKYLEDINSYRENPSQISRHIKLKKLFRIEDDLKRVLEKLENSAMHYAVPESFYED